MTGPAGRVMVHEKRLNLRFMFQVYKLTVEITSSQRCRYSRSIYCNANTYSLPIAFFDPRARPTFVNYKGNLYGSLRLGFNTASRMGSTVVRLGNLSRTTTYDQCGFRSTSRTKQFRNECICDIH